MASLQKKEFGTTPAGEKIDLFILKNSNGMEVKIINYGGRIISLTAPDKNGEFKNVVLNFDSLKEYTNENPYFGALIGRYGNRIADGEFYLDGERFTLPKNNGENHLHGGEKGFDRVVWNTEIDTAGNSLKLSYLSEHLEQGYPGNLETYVTYTLKEDNSLEVFYEATTDKKTVVNLTQHSYFNLSGDFNSTILDHEVQINADEYLPIDGSFIPTGEYRQVERSPFDFRNPKKLDQDIDNVLEYQQIERGKGYDHCFVLNEKESGVRFAASAHHPETGRFLEVFTDQPGIQLYTGNFLDGTLTRPGGTGTYARRSGFCLETQHFPDSPNQKNFPPTTLEPGQKYSTTTIFKFSVKE